MNERIAKLMDQAGELAYEEHKAKCLKNGLDPMMPFGNNLMAILEKFTELLIKEAINTVQSVGDKASNDIPFEVTDLFVSQLRQRFGVQE